MIAVWSVENIYGLECFVNSYNLLRYDFLSIPISMIYSAGQ